MVYDDDIWNIFNGWKYIGNTCINWGMPDKVPSLCSSKI
jgi:hypothetical protein